MAAKPQIGNPGDEEEAPPMDKRLIAALATAGFLLVILIVLLFAYNAARNNVQAYAEAAKTARDELDVAQEKNRNAAEDLKTAQADLKMTKTKLAAALAQSASSGATPDEIKKIVVAATKNCRAPSIPVAPSQSAVITPMPAVGSSASASFGRGPVRYQDPVTGAITTTMVNSRQEAMAWVETQQNLCTQRLRASPGANSDASCNNLRKIN